MAKITSPIKIEGTIHDMTFYKSQDGHLVRAKGGVSAQKIKNDPAFARTRENGAEFGSAAQAGKLLRQAVNKLLLKAKDSKVTARVTQIMTIIKNHDTSSVRGERNVGVGIGTTNGKKQLLNFNFNQNAVLSSVLMAQHKVNTTTGVITLNGFVPNANVVYPQGCTHVSLSGCWTRIDFAANTTEVEFTNIANLVVDGTSSNVVLTPAAVPAGTGGTSLFLLAVEFFQQVNGMQYVLNNGSYNALAIVAVV